MELKNCCKYFNDLSNGEGKVNPELRQLLMSKTGNMNAKIRLELVTRPMDPENTAYVVLCYGDSSNMYQHCQVLGIASNKNTGAEITIFESVERLAKISIPGYISMDVLSEGETFQYTDKEARAYYGVDIESIHIGDNPVDDDLLIVTQINIATNEDELKKAIVLY